MVKAGLMSFIADPWQRYWGFRDARLEERVQMNEKDIADWTEAMEKEE